MKSPKPQSANRKMNVPRPEGYSALRVWERKAKAKRSPGLLIKCGDCENAFEIFYDEEALEIAGVHASVENWREILLPLLMPKSRK